jgi:hypothetical protein
MATITTYQRGDFVRYEGSIKRFQGTWWTVHQVNRARTGRVVSYTLRASGIGRLTNVSPQHVTQSRAAGE